MGDRREPRETAVSKFVLMFHEGDAPEAPTQEVMDSWMAWFAELGDSIAEMGSPFSATATVASDGTSTDGGGPNPASGYTVVEAASLDAAVAMARSCPGLLSGGSVKVYELARMG
jgi:hypothetical protein